MPFKPLGHGRPSGDLVIGTELWRFLRDQGHDIRPVSRLRCRWIYWKPWLWVGFAAEFLRLRRRLSRWVPDLWLTYHAYYKAPDLLGPPLCRTLDLPYVIFQGVYSTKQRRRKAAMPGFYLNRRSLLAADAVIANKRRDLTNLRRLLPSERLHYIAPGIHAQAFAPDPGSRTRLRQRWGCGDRPVVATAAMLRPGVKTEGILEVISACEVLVRGGLDLFLVIIGDGSLSETVRDRANRGLPGRFRMAGRRPRGDLHRYFAAADLFAFPGVREGLGMVFLEAQACGLPVVAYRDWGASEAVVHGETGLLVPSDRPGAFAAAIGCLLRNEGLRMRMAAAAHRHVEARHDLSRNYEPLCRILAQAAAGPRPGAKPPADLPSVGDAPLWRRKTRNAGRRSSP